MKKMTFRASGTRAKNDFKGVVVIEKIKQEQIWVENG